MLKISLRLINTVRIDRGRLREARDEREGKGGFRAIVVGWEGGAAKK